MNRRPLRYLALALALPLLTAQAASADYAWQHEFIRGPRGREYNLIMPLNVRTQNPEGRIYFAVRDTDNCYRLDMTADTLRFVKVEFGVETSIGTVSPQGLTEGANRVIIKRRRQTMTAVLNGRVVAEAYDDAFTAGQVGVGVKAGSIEFSSEHRVYATGEIHFVDNFMTVRDDGWNPVSGTWSLLESPTPSMSANPFKYSGRRATRAAAISTPVHRAFLNWDNYSAQVSFRDMNGAAVGIIFYYQDPLNYHLFRWSGRQSNKPSRELVRVRDGRETILATAPGGFISEVWYKLRVDVIGTRATAYIDNTPVLYADDDHLYGGSIALYTESANGTTFDDLAVYDTGYGFFEDRFVQACPGRWLELGGTWTVENGTMTGNARRSAKAISGDSRWRDYSLAAAIGPPSNGAAGLVFYYHDELNHHLYRMQPDGRREIISYLDGNRKVLANARLEPEETEQTVITIDEGVIRVSVNGLQIIETFDNQITEGRFGMYVEQATVSFAALNVTTPPPPEPVETISDDVFEVESQMEVFASDQRDWILAGKPDAVNRNWSWYRVNLFGDVSVALSMPEGLAAGTGMELALSAQSETPTTGQPDSGYRLRAWKTDTWQIAIMRGRAELARTSVQLEGDITRIEFSRKGTFLFAKLNRRLELWARDSQPLSGTRAGYAVIGAAPAKLEAQIFCSNLLNYTFGRSPVDWRRAAGEWEVASRWACDERWAWFSGDARGGPAITWNKYKFKGDFSIEFCGAVRMDSTRGRQYDYARDMNVTVAADGQHLTSGYSFIYGGWNNQLTALLRKTEIVAKPEQINKHRFSHSGREHRRWFYHKIERQGNTLRWHVDDELVLEYKDPQPLQGERIALWFYDVGVTVARVRISAEHIVGFEHPDSITDAPPKTIYEFIPKLPE